MLPLTLGLCLIIFMVGLRRRWQSRHAVYQGLSQTRGQWLNSYQPVLVARSENELRSRFQTVPLVYVQPFLSAASLARLQTEAETNRQYAERSYIPGHKKGGTLAYESLHTLAPHCLALYHADATRQWLSAVVGTDVYPTCDHDQSSCSILYYDRPGDHIGWHYDHNFYKGRHFTVLLALCNTCAAHGKSSGRLLYRGPDHQIQSLYTPPNMLILFEGAHIRHCATAMGQGDLRIMLSMTYATNPRIGGVQEVGRRIKDIAYYGPRALWD